MSRSPSHLLVVIALGVASPLLAQARAPLSLEVSAGVGLSRGGSLRGAALPSFRGDAHALGAVGAGVRVQ